MRSPLNSTEFAIKKKKRYVRNSVQLLELDTSPTQGWGKVGARLGQGWGMVQARDSDNGIDK